MVIKSLMKFGRFSDYGFVGINISILVILDEIYTRHTFLVRCVYISIVVSTEHSWGRWVKKE